MTARTIRRSLLVSLAVQAACLGALTWSVRRGHAEEGREDRAAASTAPAEAPLPDPSSLLAARDPAEVRTLVRRCRSANASSLRDLRRAALASEDPLVAGNALRAAARLGGVDEEEIGAFLRDPRLRMRQEAVIALGERRSPEAVRRLETVLEEGDPVLRPLALRSLGRIGTPEARLVLERCAADPGATAADRAFASGALDSRS